MQLQLKNLCEQHGTKCAVNHVNACLSPGVYELLRANGAVINRKIKMNA